VNCGSPSAIVLVGIFFSLQKAKKARYSMWYRIDRNLFLQAWESWGLSWRMANEL
jgi:hypothetical protein